MRGGAAAARVAHNHEVTGSSPVPATKSGSEGASASFCFQTGYLAKSDWLLYFAQLCYTCSMFLAILFGLLSMTGFSLANVSSQPLAKKLGNAQILFLRGITVVLVLAILAIPSIHNAKNISQVAFSLFLGMAGYLPLLAFTHGIKVSRIGIVSPIAGCSPLVTVILAFAVLGVPIKSIQWVAIVLIILANVCVSINLKNFRDSNITKLTSGVPFALIAAFGWGLFFFALIYPSKAIGPWLTSFFVELGVVLAAGVHLLVSKQRTALRQALSPKIAGNGLCIAVGTIAFTVGVSRYNVGIVAALGNSVALLSTLLAAYFFKEKLTRAEMIVSGVMILGVILISLS